MTLATASEGQASAEAPVAMVADARLAVGPGALPLYLSHDWGRPLSGIGRAVVVLHGRRRDADVYRQAIEQAAHAAGPAADDSLLIVPQFLATADVVRHRLPAETLHWTWESWMGGAAAEGPAPWSSFDALDAILARLGDRQHFPDLARVVIAGHSGGAQVAQRYAVIGRGGDRLEAAGITVRYLVANPSSYVYFSADRPVAIHGPGIDRWKYGMHDLPPYAAARATADFEQDYVRRRVTYLLGAADNDPDQPALDRSAPALAQGPHRLARGLAYLAYLRARHPGLGHRLAVVPGVGHDGGAMFRSPDGLAALFEGSDS